LKDVGTHWGAEHFWQLPTLFWLNAGDNFLQVICLLGAEVSLMVLQIFFAGWALLFTRRFYLSIFHMAQPFLSFQ
jgi:lipase maturation factor 1